MKYMEYSDIIKHTSDNSYVIFNSKFHKGEVIAIAEISFIITLATQTAKLISWIKNKKKKQKSVPRKTVRRKPKQTKDEELIVKFLKNPEDAIKEIGAEYVVKHRKKIIKGITKRLTDEFLD